MTNCWEAPDAQERLCGIGAEVLSLRGSGIRLYLFPGYAPDAIVAFTEGPLGAIVAAQEGLAVGAVKGCRSYTVPDGSPLPELAGADLGGRLVPYIPDRDDPPNEEILAPLAGGLTCRELAQLTLEDLGPTQRPRRPAVLLAGTASARRAIPHRSGQQTPWRRGWPRAAASRGPSLRPPTAEGLAFL